MSTAARLGAFAAVLALVLAGGLGLGRAVGPVGGATEASHRTAAEAASGHADDGQAERAEAAQDGHGEAAQDEHADDGAHGSAHGEAPTGITGLAVSEDGYALRPETTALPLGTSTFRFAVDGPDGVLADYDVTHEKELHLVVVRRDATGFQHLHPVRGADGTWSTDLALDRPGAYRAYADFAPAGQPARTLAVDLLVAGDFQPQPLPAPSSTTQVDGFDVRLLDDHLTAGEESTLAFGVTRGGAPVALEPYLGATGHLVALREGDLGYLHVHADGDALQFATTAPTPGRYRLYLQFSVDGVVRTAELTVEAEEAHS